MSCPKCNTGYILVHTHMDFDERGAHYAHCLNCGYHTDAVMEQNRHLTEDELRKVRSNINRVGVKPARSFEVEL